MKNETRDLLSNHDEQAILDFERSVEQMEPAERCARIYRAMKDYSRTICEDMHTQYGIHSYIEKKTRDHVAVLCDMYAIPEKDFYEYKRTFEKEGDRN